MADTKPNSPPPAPSPKASLVPTRYPTAWQRWTGIVLRTAHIATASVFFGGCVLHVAFPHLKFWHHGVIASGCLLLAMELLHDRRWLHRGKGLLGALHIGLGLLIHIIPGLQTLFLWIILITGCIGSHMPRRFRHWSLLDGPELPSSQSPSL